MNAHLTWATSARVLRQIRHDRRTLALLLVVPCLLLGLAAWVFDQTPIFDTVGGPLLGIFPFVIMFLLTSIVTLRERQTGTMERLFTMPLGKGDFVAGYALAFGLLATIQAAIASLFAVWVLDLSIAGPVWMLIVVAVVDAVLGSVFGLFLSAFAATEFQAVQFMPAFVLPQFFLCGLFVERSDLPRALELLSDVLPLSYAVDAMKEIVSRTDPGTDVAGDLLIILVFVVASIAAGAATLRRRTA